jgi:inhibitor of KinA sporulation pathway (predicted exonuclease)
VTRCTFGNSQRAQPADVVHGLQTPFCTELTGISRETVRSAPLLGQVLWHHDRWLRSLGFLPEGYPDIAIDPAGETPSPARTMCDQPSSHPAKIAGDRGHAGGVANDCGDLPALSFLPVTWTDWDFQVQLEMECQWRGLRKPPYFVSWCASWTIGQDMVYRLRRRHVRHRAGDTAGRKIT